MQKTFPYIRREENVQGSVKLYFVALTNTDAHESICLYAFV